MNAGRSRKCDNSLVSSRRSESSCRDLPSSRLDQPHRQGVKRIRTDDPDSMDSSLARSALRTPRLSPTPPKFLENVGPTSGRCVAHGGVIEEESILPFQAVSALSSKAVLDPLNQSH